MARRKDAARTTLEVITEFILSRVIGVIWRYDARGNLRLSVALEFSSKMKTHPQTIRVAESFWKFYLIEIGGLPMARLHYRFASLFAAIFLLAAPALWAQSGTIQLTVDATQVPLGIVKTHMVMPVHAGPLTLYYPK